MKNKWNQIQHVRNTEDVLYSLWISCSQTCLAMAWTDAADWRSPWKHVTAKALFISLHLQICIRTHLERWWRVRLRCPDMKNWTEYRHIFKETDDDYEIDNVLLPRDVSSRKYKGSLNHYFLSIVSCCIFPAVIIYSCCWCWPHTKVILFSMLYSLFCIFVYECTTDSKCSWVVIIEANCCCECFP